MSWKEISQHLVVCRDHYDGSDVLGHTTRPANPIPLALEAVLHSASHLHRAHLQGPESKQMKDHLANDLLLTSMAMSKNAEARSEADSRGNSCSARQPAVEPEAQTAPFLGKPRTESRQFPRPRPGPPMIDSRLLALVSALTHTRLGANCPRDTISPRTVPRNRPSRNDAVG